METTIEALQDLRQLLAQSRSAEVIDRADAIVASSVEPAVAAMAYYLRGNAYRQQGDVRQAMNSYLEARALDPTGPAAQAVDTLREILNFYDHDLYNP